MLWFPNQKTNIKKQISRKCSPVSITQFSFTNIHSMVKVSQKITGNNIVLLSFISVLRF